MSLTHEEQIGLIKSVLDEAGELRTLTDAQLEAFLVRSGGDENGAIYLGALQKARVDAAALPDGTSMPSNRAYWLGLAAAFRPNRGGAMKREGR